MTFIPVEVISKTEDNKAAAPARALTIEHGVPRGRKTRQQSRRKSQYGRQAGARAAVQLRSAYQVALASAFDADVDEAALRLVLSAMKEA